MSFQCVFNALLVLAGGFNRWREGVAYYRTIFLKFITTYETYLRVVYLGVSGIPRFDGAQMALPDFTKKTQDAPVVEEIHFRGGSTKDKPAPPVWWALWRV